MAKLLRTKRVYLYIAWTNIKNTRPSDFATGDEMDAMFEEVLPLMEEEVLAFRELLDETAEVQNKFAVGKFSEEETRQKLDQLNQKLRRVELNVGKEIVEISLDNDWFNKLFQIFERMGKGWFNIAENYYEFRKDMNDANADITKKKKARKGAT